MVLSISEGCALMEGISLALECSDLPIIVQTDCASILSVLKDPVRNRSTYGHLFDEVKRLLSLRVFVLVKIDREQNKVAHCLANYGRSDDSTACWLRQIPDCASQLVLADCNLIS
jgi:hypothetical protein